MSKESGILMFFCGCIVGSLLTISAQHETKQPVSNSGKPSAAVSSAISDKPMEFSICIGKRKTPDAKYNVPDAFGDGFYSCGPWFLGETTQEKQTTVAHLP